MANKVNDHPPPETETPGVAAAFPYDRMTVERFREAFPRARWNDEHKAWFVPGKTAERRVDRWLAREAEQVGVYADIKGRDAYEFDPIASPYLEVADDMRIRTPYSRTVLAALRKIPWSHWDDDLRAWRIPFRSYEELQQRWQIIEAAARRNEPEERKRRREAERNSPEQRLARLRSAEQRRRRYPLAVEDELPPIDRPVTTKQYGIVVFTEFAGELADDSTLVTFYPHSVSDGFSYIWGTWRTATLSELVATWPARQDPEPKDFSRGWWRPTLSELREARHKARSLERRRQVRSPAVDT
ncbi:hypothetical protein LJR231_002622 [Phyllobacterium sp. LjRoot231]|uniref:hypothetical protein n=1 Tax=Phyllobacterium sp. LjRoot231 TaxID=3342289 RepID=UPI003ECCCFF5